MRATSASVRQSSTYSKVIYSRTLHVKYTWAVPYFTNSSYICWNLFGTNIGTTTFLIWLFFQLSWYIRSFMRFKVDLAYYQKNWKHLKLNSLWKKRGERRIWRITGISLSWKSWTLSHHLLKFATCSEEQVYESLVMSVPRTYIVHYTRDITFVMLKVHR
jgi:hypothetical protein